MHKVKVEVTDIEQLRRARKIRYSDIERMGMSRGTFHSIANGKRDVSQESIEKMVQIFKVPETDIRGLLKNAV